MRIVQFVFIHLHEMKAFIDLFHESNIETFICLFICLYCVVTIL